MALGGWEYTSYDWNQASHGGTEMLNALTGFLASITSRATWSLHTAAQIYDGNNSRCWGVVTNGTVYVTFAFVDMNSVASFDLTNTYSGAQLSAYYSLYITWGTSAPTGHPLVANSLPGPFRYAEVTRDFSAGDRYHILTRGDNMVLARAADYATSTEIDDVGAWGPDTFSSLVHGPTDTHTDGLFLWSPAVTYDNTAFLKVGCQCLDAAGNMLARLLTGGSGPLGLLSAVHAFTISTTVCDRSPYAWTPIYICLSTLDLDTGGTVAGSGEKGVLNPEMVRLVSLAAPVMTPLAGGDMVYFRNGLCVGFDSGYPGLS